MQKYIRIKNGNAELTVDLIGAQIVSYKIDGVEVMFQGALQSDKAQWAKTAPNLFPNPGPISDSKETTAYITPTGRIEKRAKYKFNNAEKEMAQHGPIQNMEFTCQAHNPDSCILGLQSNDYTYNQFPFKFKYTVDLGLDKSGRLEYRTVAYNRDNKSMIGGMGWHPAFKLHFEPKRYTVVFRNLIKKDDSNVEEDREYEIADSIVNASKSCSFSGIVSADVVIMYTNEQGEKIPYLSMHTEEPRFILWSRKAETEDQESFIAIEPWNTSSKQISKLSTQGKTESLRDQGVVVVSPGEEVTLKAKVSVNPEYLQVVNEYGNNTLELFKL